MPEVVPMNKTGNPCTHRAYRCLREERQIFSDLTIESTIMISAPKDNALRVYSISTLVWKLRKGILWEMTFKFRQEIGGAGQEKMEEGAKVEGIRRLITMARA